MAETTEIDEETNDSMSLFDSDNEEDNNDLMPLADSENEENNSDEEGDLGSSQHTRIDSIEDLGCIVFELLTPDEVWQYNFLNVDIAYDFFNEYGKARGFSLRKNKQGRSIQGQILWKSFVCSREGLRAEKFVNNPNWKREARCNTRCGCEVDYRVHIVAETGRWYVSMLNDVHNHELMIDKFVGRLKSHRRMTDAVVAKMKSMRKVGISTPKFFRSFAQQSGGYGNIGFDKKQMYNVLSTERKKQNGDANAAINLLRQMAAVDPKMFWSHMEDNEGQLRHLIWCDGEFVVDYEVFGEVVAFDATYGRNQYKCPVVVFSGVNHHKQTIVFAYALVSDETKNTHTWLLEQFLRAMDRKHPKAVITDGDVRMRNAIERVFPQAHHRLCAWHLLRNATSNVRNKKFKQAFSKCMFSDYEVHVFEEKWREAVVANGVENHTWVRGLYARKNMWAAAHMRGKFFAGLRTTSRCEGLHTQMGKYVGARDSLFEFLQHFQRCLDYMRNNEAEADKRSIEGDPIMVTRVPTLEMSAAKIYTLEVFLEFRDKLLYLVCVNMVGLKETISSVIYTVSKYSSSLVRLEWFVSHYRNDRQWMCSCKGFEFYGIPCVHILFVIVHLRIHELPQSLVCRRWCKNPKEGLELRDAMGNTSNASSRCTRFAALQHCSRRLCSVASQSLQDFIQVREIFNVEIEKRLSKAPSAGPSGSTAGANVHHSVRDLVRVRSKGCGPSGQRQVRKKEQRCTLCRDPGHNKRRCPNPMAEQPVNSTLNDDLDDESEDSEQIGDDCANIDESDNE